jgi:hypothetical protein
VHAGAQEPDLDLITVHAEAQERDLDLITVHAEDQEPNLDCWVLGGATWLITSLIRRKWSGRQQFFRCSLKNGASN